MISVGILTVSDKGARGERLDASGDLLAELVAGIPAEVVARQVVADEKDEIAGALRDMAQEVDIIFTTHRRSSRRNFRVSESLCA